MAYDGRVLRQATLRFDEDKQRRQEQQEKQQQEPQESKAQEQAPDAGHTQGRGRKR